MKRLLLSSVCALSLLGFGATAVTAQTSDADTTGAAPSATSPASPGAPTSPPERMSGDSIDQESMDGGSSLDGLDTTPGVADPDRQGDMSSPSAASPNTTSPSSRSGDSYDYERSTRPDPSLSQDRQGADRSSVLPESQQSAQAQAEEPSPFGNLTVGAIIGQSVADAEGTEVGEVDDILLDESGRIDAMIVRTSGFLGMGGKLVKIDGQDVEIEQGGGGLALTSMTKSDLEALPGWDEA